MKKFIIMLVMVVLMIPGYAEAKEATLNELLAQAQANREAYAKAKAEKELSEQEKAEATKEKQAVQAEVEKTKENIKRLEEEIVELQKSINTKDKEIKKLMEFVQVANGENTYMEYIFGASDFTDFIYRVSVAEQLSSYNDQLIEEYNKEIEESEKQKKELAKKEQELNEKEQELSILEAKLSKEIETIKHGMLSKDQEYKTQINTINSMKKMGCKGTDTLTVCQNRIISQVSPSYGGNISVTNASGTYMPLARGYLTSDYGERSIDYHTGIDFSSGKVDSVYPIASGTVINIDYPDYYLACGNHIVYVLHKIKGVTYTTSYWHLTSVSVKVGQAISATTKIGTIAGRGYTDGCNGSTCCAYGGHVHLNLFRGYKTNNSGRINPRIVMPQLPREGAYFSHR